MSVRRSAPCQRSSPARSLDSAASTPLLDNGTVTHKASDGITSDFLRGSRRGVTRNSARRRQVSAEAPSGVSPTVSRRAVARRVQWTRRAALRFCPRSSALRRRDGRDLNGEFDPGSGRTLAARLTHASRTRNSELALGGQWRTGEEHVRNLPWRPGQHRETVANTGCPHRIA